MASLVIVLVTAASLAVMGWAFWEHDLRYSLPTPRPPDLRQVPRGEVQELPAVVVDRIGARRRPVLLHFYSPRCPCSRFNREHVAVLQQRFADRVQFVEVVPDVDGGSADSGLSMPRVVDPDGVVARACGVYATPQALLLDAESRVVFRGNFNASRWCDDPGTQFVRLAIDALLRGERAPVDPRAELPYGCELPWEHSRVRR